MTPCHRLDPVRYLDLSAPGCGFAAERELAEIAALPLCPYASADDLVAASQARGRDRLAHIAAIADHAERNPMDGINLTGMTRQQRCDLLAAMPVWPDDDS